MEGGGPMERHYSIFSYIDSNLSVTDKTFQGTIKKEHLINMNRCSSPIKMD